MSDEREVDMGKLLGEANRKVEALRKLKPDDLPPNLIYPQAPDEAQGEHRCIKAWWDLGECGLLMVMEWSDYTHLTDGVEFRIMRLTCAPYGRLEAPCAELEAKTDKTAPQVEQEPTLNILEAEEYIGGWVDGEGEVTLIYPGFPFDKDVHDSPLIKLHWNNVDRFSDEIRQIVRRVTYEAALVGVQIKERVFGYDTDVEAFSPYVAPAESPPPVAAPLPAENNARRTDLQLEKRQLRNRWIIYAALAFLLGWGWSSTRPIYTPEVWPNAKDNSARSVLGPNFRDVDEAFEWAAGEAQSYGPQAAFRIYRNRFYRKKAGMIVTDGEE